MNDYFDGILKSEIDKIDVQLFTNDEIKRIFEKSKKIRKKQIVLKIACLTVMLLVVSACLIYCKSSVSEYITINISPKAIDTDFNYGIEENDTNAELYTEPESNQNSTDILEENKKILGTVTYNSGFDQTSASDAGCYASSSIVQNMSKIYIVKVESILGYSFENEVPKTKLLVTILKRIEGTEDGIIEISINGGLVSIYELENSSLNYSISTDYTNLSDDEKKNTYVNLISEEDYINLASPVAGNTYIVSLNSENNVVTNAKYSFLEFDTSSNMYKTGETWRNFEN